MAFENALVYALVEIPTLVLSKILARRFALTPRKAQAAATFTLLALGMGACFLAWFLYPGR